MPHLALCGAVPFSILAPHEGERHGHIYRHAIAAGFSILAPHEGERPEIAQVNGEGGAFQSSLPTRGSDEAVEYAPGAYRLFSILAPHEGERRMQ